MAGNLYYAVGLGHKNAFFWSQLIFPLLLGSRLYEMSVCNPILANRARCQLCREGKKTTFRAIFFKCFCRSQSRKMLAGYGCWKIPRTHFSPSQQFVSHDFSLSLFFLYLLALWMAHVIYSSSFLSLSSKHLLSYFPLFSSSSSTNLLLVFPSHRPVCLAARSLTTTY